MNTPRLSNFLSRWLKFSIAFIIAFLCIANNLTAQTYSKHYIAPAPWNYFTDANELVVTTASMAPVEVSVRNSNDVEITKLYPKAGDPKVYRFTGNITSFPLHKLKTVLSGMGLIVEANKSINVNIRNVASDENDNDTSPFVKGNSSLFSFGDAAIGNAFRVGYYRDGEIYSNSFPNGPSRPIYSVMAIESNTVVSINGVATITLNKGQSYLFEADMGSLVETSGPVVMNTSATYDAPTVGESCYDGASNPVPPINSLGKEYVVVRGNGNNIAEKTTVIATEPNTLVTIYNFNAAGVLQSTETRSLIAGGSFTTFSNGIAGAGADSNSPQGQRYSSTRIVASSNVVAYSGTAQDCEVDVATLAPIADCAGSNRTETYKFRKLTTTDDLPYFSYILLQSATEKVLLSTDNGYTNQDIETISGVGARRQLGSSGTYLIDFDNININNPSVITLTSNARLTVNMVQQGGGFSMSNFLSPFPEKADKPIVSQSNCASATLSTAPNSSAPYQWYLNGLAIAGETNATHQALISGTYTVTSQLNCGISAQSLPVTIALCNVDLSMVKTVSNSNPAIGSTVVFSLTANNSNQPNGAVTGTGNAIGVSATDLLPSGYTFVSADAPTGTSYNAVSGVWSIGAMSSGETKVLKITATVKKSGVYDNTATIDGPQIDPVVTNDVSTVIVTPVDLTLISETGTDAQNICSSVAIAPITYQFSGTVTNLSVDGLPATLIPTYNNTNNTYELTGIPPINNTGIAIVYTYTVKGTVSGTALQATGTITVNSEVATPVFAKGATSARCQGSSVESYTAATAGATPITYSISPLDAGVINTTTGEVTWSAIYAGPAVITATTTGCNGTKTAEHTVAITTSGTVDGTITVCSGASGSVELKNTTADVVRWEASTNDGISWTEIANSSKVLAYNNINTTTIYRAIVTGNGCVAAISLSAKVTVNPRPVIANQTIEICKNSNFTFAPAYAPNGTTYTWSLPTVSGGSVSGQSAGSGLLEVNQTLTNTGATSAVVTYTVTPSYQGCDGTPFTITVNISDCSSISITKTADVTSVNKAGDIINYTIVVTNTGKLQQNNVTVNDPFIILDAPVKTNGNADAILDKGEIWTYTGAYIVNQSDLDNNGKPTVNNGSINNVATFSSTEIPSQTASNSVAIQTNSKLVLVKTGVLAANGDEVTYTFTVQNTGNVTINNLVLSDNKIVGAIALTKNTLLPNETTTATATYQITDAEKLAGSVTNTATVVGNNPQGAEVNATSGSANNNTTPTVTKTGVYPLNDDGTVNAVTGGIAVENVLVNDKLDGNQATVTNVTITQISSTHANVSVNANGEVKVLPNTPVGVYTLTYEIEDKANPNNKKQAIVTVTVTSGLIVAKDDSGTANGFEGGVAVENILANDTFDSGKAATISTVKIEQLSSSNNNVNIDPLTGKVNVLAGTPAGTYTLTYQITDLLDASKKSTATVTVVVPNWVVDLAVTKVANKTSVEANEGISYTITVTNNGTATLLANQTFGLTESLPQGLTQVNYQANGGTYNAANHSFTTAASLAIGQTVSLVVNGVVANNFTQANLTNAVAVSVPTGVTDPNTNNNNASVTTTILAGKMQLLKTGALSADGNSITYTFTINNTGNVALNNINLVDAKINLNKIIAGSVAPGASITTTEIYVLSQGDKDAGSLSNTATATAKTPAGNTVTANSGNGTNNTDPTVTILPGKPGFTFTKLASGTVPSTIGGVVNYNLVVTNTGNVTLTNIVVTDNNATITNGTVATLAPGQSATVLASHILTQSDINAGKVINQASITAKSNDGKTITKVSDDPSTATVDDATVTVIAQVATVTFTKTVNNTGAKKGDVLNYTLMAKNTGTVTLYDVYIVDETADAGSVMPVKVDFILPGATAVFMAKRTITQADINVGFFSNQAIFYGKDPQGRVVRKVSDDPRTALADDPTVTVFTPTADLVTVKRLKNSNQTTYKPGEEVLYVINIKNNGPSSAKDVRVVDHAPAGTTITKWSATAKGLVLPSTSGVGDLDQLIPTFPGEGEVEYEVTVQTANGATNPQAAGKPLSNTVAVTSTTLDLTTVGDILTTPAINAVITNDLSIVKTSDHLTPTGVDTPFDYTITVKNNGLFPATAVSVNDVMPANLTYVSHSIATGTAVFDVSKNAIVWNVSNIPAGETITLKLTVKAKNAGVVSNTATVSAAETDTDLANNTSTDNKQVFALNTKPNVITPNGDGKNDTFVIDGLELYPENSINIFNRWGNEVFRSVGSYKNNWDGHSLKEGTYYYILKIKDANGNWSATKGFITLLRNN